MAQTKPATYSINNCSIVAKAAPINRFAASALEEAAIALQENAKAVVALVEALKGTAARIETGIRLGGE